MPDWCDPAPYAALAGHDAAAHAWEWLRRDPAYVRAFQFRSVHPAMFGLYHFEDPALDACDARPIWLECHDPFAVTAGAERGNADDAFDLARIPCDVTCRLDIHGREHLLVGPGGRTIRLHLTHGSVRDGPVCLNWRLPHIDAAIPALLALRQLVLLCRDGRAPSLGLPSRARSLRWLQLLRVADAIAAGASQRDIASVLFGSRIPAIRWRVEAGSYRLRVQRLVRASRHVNARNALALLRPPAGFGGATADDRRGCRDRKTGLQPWPVSAAGLSSRT